MGWVGSTVSGEKPPEVHRSLLEYAVRSQINKPTGDLTATDLPSSPTSRALNKGIQTLTGLGVVPERHIARPRQQRIEDLSPLSGLTKLTSLYVDDNNIMDVSPLARDLVDLARSRADNVTTSRRCAA